MRKHFKATNYPNGEMCAKRLDELSEEASLETSLETSLTKKVCMKPLNDVLKEVRKWKKFKGYFSLGKYRFIVVINNGILAARDKDGIKIDSNEIDEPFDEPVFSINRIIIQPYPHVYSATYEQAIIVFPELLQIEYEETNEDDLIREIYQEGFKG